MIQIDDVTLHLGDLRDVLPTLPENSVDYVCTDPPYGINFMGRGWDHAVPGPEYWEAVLRVCKPGAMMLAFGGTRTYHRLTCAIEDAGWTICDCLMWLYGSGMSKSGDIGKMIDKSKGAVREVVGTKIDQAVLGTCTNGRLADLQIAAEVVRGKKVAPGVRLLAIPASMAIYKRVMADGTLMTLAEAGAVICNPNCGPCMGNHQGVLAPGEVCISATNRNFQGRMGCREAEIYLASPATVAASAVAGYIADPREYLVGKDTES